MEGMEGIQKLIELNEKGLLSNEDLATVIKQYVKESNQEQKTETNKYSVEENRKRAEENRRKVELINQNHYEKEEFQKAEDFLKHVKHRVTGERVYSDEAINEMSYYEAIALADDIKSGMSNEELQKIDREIEEAKKAQEEAKKAQEEPAKNTQEQTEGTSPVEPAEENEEDKNKENNNANPTGTNDDDPLAQTDNINQVANEGGNADNGDNTDSDDSSDGEQNPEEDEEEEEIKKKPVEVHNKQGFVRSNLAKIKGKLPAIISAVGAGILVGTGAVAALPALLAGAGLVVAGVAWKHFQDGRKGR